MKSKTFKFVLLTSIICIFQIKTVFSQHICGTAIQNDQYIARYPELQQAYIEYVKELNKKSTLKSGAATPTGDYTIPMVFHILNINGSENIPDDSIYAVVARMNIDYHLLNPDKNECPPYFQSIQGKANVTFKLATIDLNGNCTNGIDRIYTHKTIDANDDSKINQWPRDKYFNVWVVRNLLLPGVDDPDAVLGVATFPSMVNTINYFNDGILIRADECGFNHYKRTLTHETGHWLSLEHPWGNEEVDTRCGNDGVEDTPITKGQKNVCYDYDFTCDTTTLIRQYNFNSVTTTSGPVAPDSIGVPFKRLSFSDVSANGVSANSSVNGMFSFSQWPDGAPNGATTFASLTGSLNLGKYYEFTVAPTDSVGLSLQYITFGFQRNSTGVRTYAVRSSVNGFASNLPASVVPANTQLIIQQASTLPSLTGNIFFCKNDTNIYIKGSRISLGNLTYEGFNTAAFQYTGIQAPQTPITFRIYGFNAEDSITGTFGIDSLSIKGIYGQLENINNYMDYADSATRFSCGRMFTQGQVERLRTAMFNSTAQRNQLITTSNLAATGITTPMTCGPTPAFFSNRTSVCATGPFSSRQITFTSNTQNVTQDPANPLRGISTTYQWSFPGGTPATATATTTSLQPNPPPVTVTYSTPGVYDVTLTATNANGTGTTVQSSYVYVYGAWAQVSNDYSEDFENPSEVYSYWTIDNLDENAHTWIYESHLGYNSTHCMKMDAYKNYNQDVDLLYSPSYDLRFISNASISFKCAASTLGTTTETVNDVLKLWVSTDCGATWGGSAGGPLKTFAGGTLINNGYIPTEFFPSMNPTDEAQWATLSATIPATYLKANTRFKYEYTSGKEGNNIFIDNINITGTVGINDYLIETADVSLFPNPTNQTTTLAYHLDAKSTAKIELLDLLGKKIMDVNNVNQVAGDYTVQISKQDLNLNNGIYFIKFTLTTDDKTSTTTKKLIITK